MRKRPGKGVGKINCWRSVTRDNCAPASELATPDASIVDEPCEKQQNVIVERLSRALLGSVALINSASRCATERIPSLFAAYKAFRMSSFVAKMRRPPGELAEGLRRYSTSAVATLRDTASLFARKHTPVNTAASDSSLQVLI